MIGIVNEIPQYLILRNSLSHSRLMEKLKIYRGYGEELETIKQDIACEDFHCTDAELTEVFLNGGSGWPK